MIHSIKFRPGHTITRRTGPVVFQNKKMGSLGIGIGTSSQSQVMRSATDISSGASTGALVGSVVPGIGNVIGAAVGAAIGAIGSLFGPAKEGQAAMTWDDMVNHGYLFNTRGQAFDERYIGEAMKGAMDKGNNVWPGCGADGYKNPDCFYAPLAHTIVSGYLAGKVPLSATTAQVYNTVVVPWLQSGAGGLFNWANYSKEATQNQALLVQAAVDRYIGGLPITRANMPAYASQASNYTAWSTPQITVALASLLTPPKPVTTAAPVVQSGSGAAVVAAPAKATVQPIVATPVPVVVKATAPAAAPNAPPAAAAAPAIPAGSGYNYAGLVVPAPPGYTVNPQGYIIDASGYIFGSANDDQLTAAANLPPVVSSNYVPQSPPSNITVTTPSEPVSAPASDNTMLYLVGGAALLFVLMNKKKK